MALATQLYLVTKDIAIRSGLIESRYRIADGRFVLDNKDLSRVRFTPDEYISGLDGVEKVSEDEAETLIAQNGYQMGEDVEQQQAQQQYQKPQVNTVQKQSYVQNANPQALNSRVIVNGSMKKVVSAAVPARY